MCPAKRLYTPTFLAVRIVIHSFIPPGLIEYLSPENSFSGQFWGLKIPQWTKQTKFLSLWSQSLVRKKGDNKRMLEKRSGESHTGLTAVGIHRTEWGRRNLPGRSGNPIFCTILKGDPSENSSLSRHQTKMRETYNIQWKNISTGKNSKCKGPEVGIGLKEKQGELCGRGRGSKQQNAKRSQWWWCRALLATKRTLSLECYGIYWEEGVKQRVKWSDFYFRRTVLVPRWKRILGTKGTNRGQCRSPLS